MKLFIITVIMAVLVSCDKVIDVKLPAYEQELVLEMYVEDGQPLRCLLIESLPYTDTAINKPVNDALIIFSDGTRNDTLTYLINQDKVTGRFYNYFHPHTVIADSTKTYSLTIVDENKKMIGTTSFSERMTAIDKIDIRESANIADSFSVGLVISDPIDTDNYYRFYIGKDINFFSGDPTDFRVSDVSFNGKSFSFFSEANFARNDTVTIRIYSLHKQHYDYLESISNARRSNVNPFSQPGRIQSNLVGGLGIFTTIRYSEQKVIIK